MRYVLLILCFSILNFSSTTKVGDDNQALSIVKQLRDKFENPTSLKLDYTVRLKFNGNVVQNKEHTHYIKDDLVRLETPFMNFIKNEDGAFMINKLTEVVFINERADSLKAMIVPTPYDFLNDAVKRGVEFSIEKEEKIDDQIIQFISVLSDSTDSSRMSIGYNVDQKELHSFEVNVSGGTEIIYHEIDRSPLSNTIFEFKREDYPEYTVLD